jgi:hypothetical protein
VIADGMVTFGDGSERFSSSVIRFKVTAVEGAALIERVSFRAHY